MPTRLKTHRAPRPAAPMAAIAEPARQYERTEDRAVAKRFYKSPAWRKLRALVLAEQPLCADCYRRGRYVAGEHVHHKQERRDRPDLALDRGNLEALCVPCHNRKRRERP